LALLRTAGGEGNSQGQDTGSEEKVVSATACISLAPDLLSSWFSFWVSSFFTG